MSHTATLQMPSNYVVMNDEEKICLEGGYRASRQVLVKAGSKRMSMEEYLNMEFLKSTIKAYLLGKIVGLTGQALAIPPTTQEYANTALQIIGFIGGNGYSNALALDRQDGAEDGMLTIRWDDFTRTEYNPYPPNSYEGAMF